MIWEIWFSESAKKTTEDDLRVMDRIDLLLGLDTLSRTVDYQLVLAAKTDLSGLSTKQILQKDLKVVKSTDGDQVWPVTQNFFLLAFCSTTAKIATANILEGKGITIPTDFAKGLVRKGLGR